MIGKRNLEMQLKYKNVMTRRLENLWNGTNILLYSVYDECSASRELQSARNHAEVSNCQDWTSLGAAV